MFLSTCSLAGSPFPPAYRPAYLTEPSERSSSLRRSARHRDELCQVVALGFGQHSFGCRKVSSSVSSYIFKRSYR
jgi:hypothetical protein